jgi:two-component system, chemotaxis family, chemotaxis protein CheY
MPVYKTLNPFTQSLKRSADKHLLVVDDQSQMRDMIRVMLKNNGYTQLMFAESGNQAMRTLARHPMDLIITDWNMPNMTGIELLKQIKGDPNRFTTPVMMVSDERAADKVRFAVEEGADGFLVKPFNERDLIRSVETALAKGVPKDELEKRIIEMQRLKLSKDYRKALELGAEILKVRKSPKVAMLICECLYQVEEYDRAISMIADTDAKGRSSQQTNLLGKIHLSLGQYSQGIQALEAAVAMNPLNHDRKIDLAGACFAAGKVEEAERVILGIVNAQPTDLNLVGIAQLYLDQGQVDKAGGYLKQTVDPIKETVPVFNNYAVALRQADRLEDATDIYRKCLKIDSDSDVLHYNLAVLYVKSNKLKEAKEAVHNALQLKPDNPYAKELLQKLGG